MIAAANRTSAARRGLAQFYPSPPDGPVYFLYDGPDEWGFRVDRDGTLTVGDDARVVGDHPNYEVSLPSGICGFVDASSRVFIEGSGFTMLGAGPDNMNLADALRTALTEAPA